MELRERAFGAVIASSVQHAPASASWRDPWAVCHVPLVREEAMGARLQMTLRLVRQIAAQVAVCDAITASLRAAGEDSARWQAALHDLDRQLGYIHLTARVLLGAKWRPDPEDTGVPLRQDWRP